MCVSLCFEYVHLLFAEDPFPPPREAPAVPYDESDDPDEVAAVMSYVNARRLGQCNLVRR